MAKTKTEKNCNVIINISHVVLLKLYLLSFEIATAYMYSDYCKGFIEIEVKSF